MAESSTGLRSTGKSRLINELATPLLEADRVIQADFRALQPEIETRLESLRAMLPRGRKKLGEVDLVDAIDLRRQIQHLESLRSLRLLLGTASCEALKKAAADAPDSFVFSMSAEGAEVGHPKYFA